MINSCALYLMFWQSNPDNGGSMEYVCRHDIMCLQVWPWGRRIQVPGSVKCLREGWCWISKCSMKASAILWCVCDANCSEFISQLFQILILIVSNSSVSTFCSSTSCLANSSSIFLNKSSLVSLSLADNNVAVFASNFQQLDVFELILFHQFFFCTFRITC